MLLLLKMKLSIFALKNPLAVLKQIKIAQIIISEVEDETQNDQDMLLKHF